MQTITDRAEALLAERRFYEWLDATAAATHGWPHNRTSAMAWLLEECEIDTLRSLSVDPEAAATYEQIEARFALWDQNGELPV